MTQRITPTHFIEVYKGYLSQYIADVAYIEDLEICLMASEQIGFETLFIWKIKLKIEKL